MQKSILWSIICLLFTCPLVAKPFDFNSFGNKLPDNVSIDLSYRSFKRPFFPDGKGSIEAGFVDLKQKIVPRSTSTQPQACQEATLFGTPGTYVSAGILVEAVEDCDVVDILLSELHSGSHVLGVENLLLRRILTGRQSIIVQKPLLIPFSGKATALKRGNYLHLFLYLMIPEGTEPGDYSGTVVVKAGDQRKALTLKLKVLEFTLPPARGSFGFFLSGTVDGGRRGRFGATAPVPEKYTLMKMRKMFEYWSKLGLNSPMVIDLEYWSWKKNQKGEYELDVSQIRPFAEAMKDVGMDGYLCLDNTYRGVNNRAWFERQGIDSVSFAVKGMQQILAHARREHWPEIIFPVEEELGNGYPSKLKNYRDFRIPMQKALGRRAYVIDNSIGWGSKKEDLGNRDGFQIIQYNSWTREAVEEAHRNKREVWLYNGGTNRSMFGLRLCAIGGTGAHQWAEMWGRKDSNSAWVYLLFDEDGNILPTLVYEEIYKGLVDYRCFHLLKNLAGELQRQGKRQASKRAQNIMEDLIKDIPLDNTGGNNWEGNHSDADHNQLQWRLVCGIREARAALGMGPAPKTAGFNDQHAVVTLTAQEPVIRENSLFLALPKLKQGKLDAVADITTPGNVTGALGWPVRKINRLKAYAADEADFKRLYQPTWTTATLYYDDQGLYVYSHQNGGGWEVEYATHEDDSPDIWKDPFVELDIKKPDSSHLYKLIVNNKGKKKLYQEELTEAQKDSIQVKNRLTPCKAHLLQEIFIPWKIFHLNEAPARGTVWQFNIARARRAREGELLTWSPVEATFSESDKFGHICFTGESGTSMFHDAKFQPLLLGKNIFSSQIRPSDAYARADVIVEVLDPQGTIVATAHPGTQSPRWFEVCLTMDANSSKQDYTIRLRDQRTGKTMETMAWPNQTGNPRIAVTSFPRHLVQAKPFAFRLHLPVTGQGTPSELNLAYTAQGKTYPLPSVKVNHGGNVLLSVSGLTLPAGGGRFSMDMKGLKVRIAPAEASVDVLPAMTDLP